MVLRRYATPILIVVVLILASVGATSYHRSSRQKAAESADQSFRAANVLAEKGRTAEAIADFEALSKSAPKGYALLARLRAAEELGKTDKAKAIEALDALADDKTTDPLTQEVALLRVALLAVEIGDREKAMMKLAPLMTPRGPFRFIGQELNGLDALFNQDYDEAERAFDILLNDKDVPKAVRQRATMYQSLLKGARGPSPESIGSGSASLPPASSDDSAPSSAPPMK